MKFYTVAELKTHASKILSLGLKANREAVITRHGKPLALLIPIAEEELEWSLREPVRARLRKAAEERAAGRVIPLRKLARDS
jgi:antitoxin (DNA-binding transcriptional repressor) of toxin-antitoxin stability system